MLIVFDVEGFVQSDCAPQDQTVNQHYYVEVPKRLILAVCRKGPKKSGNLAFGLCITKMQPRTKPTGFSFFNLFFYLFKENHGSPVVQQPPFPPDMASCDLGFFPNLEKSRKGKRFDDIDTFTGNTTKQFSRFPKDSLRNIFKNDRTAGIIG